LKIIQLVQKPQLRGAEIFACQLSNHLMELGHEVLVISIFEGDAKLPFRGKTINLDRNINKRFFDFSGWMQFNKIIKDFKPDVIQSNAADTLKFAVSSKLLFSWKHPLVYRNANKMSDFINSKLKWRLNNFYLSKVNYVISVSKECEKDFLKTFNFPKQKIETVEIGVEDQNIGDIPSDLLEIFKRGPVLAHIGGFVPEKNHKGLIAIFNKVLKVHPKTQLFLLGKGKLQDEVKKQVSDLGIQDDVHFLGYRNDVLEILKFSEAFVLPSLIEGLPAVILEAMYCETPVVAYNVGGIGEVVISGKTGWLPEKGDEEDFEKSLKEVLQKGQDGQRKVANAKQMISEKFINIKIAKRFYAAYQKALGQLE